MSRRTSIIKALAEKFKQIDGTEPYRVNLYGNAYPKLKFWDEISEWPAVYMSPGTEIREYHPADFTWAFLNVSVKVYCRGDDSQQELETLLEDLETCIDANRVLVYDEVKLLETTEILIQSITTDEGLLAPYAVGEINIQVRYALN
jgi:hypothetical protein